MFCVHRSQTFKLYHLLRSDNRKCRLYPARAYRTQINGGGLEWKTYAQDAPADLPQRIAARGFEADEREALRRGYRFLTVDAGEMSRPILEKRGFQLLTHTTPYTWNQPESD